MASWTAAGRIVVVVCLAIAGAHPFAAQGSPDLIEAELDPVVYDDLLHREQVVLEGFPLPGSPAVDLELTAFDLLTADARIVVVDEAGEREVPCPVFRSFRGYVRNQPESSVTLSLFDGRLSGSIRAHGGEFVINREQARPVTVRNRTADPDRPDRPFCSGELPQGNEGITPRSAAEIDENTLLTAEIAIDAPYEWYERFGDLTAAQNYILGVMAQVSTIYENEVNIEMKVPYLRVFTVPEDPYSDTTDAHTLLSELRAEWNANQTGVDRTVVHLFGARASGGAGVAYLDVLCSNAFWPGNSYDYGVSVISARGGAWEKEMVAHELGHNFSSPHTHCYVPEIDQCANEDGCYSGEIVATTGTIMSYCTSTIPEFHTRVETEKIRPAAEAAHPTCLAAPPASPPDPPTNLTIF